MKELLEPVVLEDAVVTVDAAHACWETAEYIAGKKQGGNRGSDYFLFVKANQAGLQGAVFPRAAQAAWIRRDGYDSDGTLISKEIVHAVTQPARRPRHRRRPGPHRPRPVGH